MNILSLPGKTALLPSGYDYPLSSENINEVLGDILPKSVAHASFEIYENTSDVLIMHDYWRTAVDLWLIRVIAVREVDLKRVRDLLESKGFPILKEWLNSANNDLHLRPEIFIQHGITLRYEHNDLISQAHEADHPEKRPPPRRPIP